MLISRLLRHGDEEANQEQDDDQQQECNRVFERSPQPGPHRLRAFFRRHLVTLFIPEVREGYHQQAQHRIQAVESVVDDLQLQEDVIHRIRLRPVLLAPQLPTCRRRDEGNVDRHEEDGSEEGEHGDEAYRGHDVAALGGLLVDEDEDGGDEDEDGEADGVGHPDQGGLDERHVVGGGGVSCKGSACVFSRGGAAMQRRGWPITVLELACDATFNAVLNSSRSFPFCSHYSRVILKKG